MNELSAEHLEHEVKRRRTFAIISHPDAGKTTLTEKLLLLGGAIRLAGSVKAKKNKKYATSDWMELEKQRGISVSTSVMNFEYEGMVCNLLDTPGHQDFSEDTYRTLSATDSAIMLIDAAKGVEAQTIKLFEVCKLRKIPIFTFINKLDRHAKPPLELIEEIENVLKIKLYPMSWPVSSGDRFKGVIERKTKSLHYFEAGVQSTNRTIPFEEISSVVPSDLLTESLEEFELVEGAGEVFSKEAFECGELSPMFFGSAMNNFGVQFFLDTFLKMAPSPGPKASSKGIIEPLNPLFSGFIFKIQANMDPKHRDRIAFLRVISGSFEGGMSVWVPRLNRQIKLSHPQQFFAQDRSVMERAYAGDVVGVYDPGLFSIGDSLMEDQPFEFGGIPSFAPEFFGVLKTSSALKRKQLMKGLTQLCQEGTVQMFEDATRPSSDPVVAAVGVLQFEVLTFRLQNEYNVDCVLEPLPYKMARWTNASKADLEIAKDKTDAFSVKDIDGFEVLLFKNNFGLSYFEETCPNISLFNNNANLVKKL
jgi:peptide chain release factor 3